MYWDLARRESILVCFQKGPRDDNGEFNLTGKGGGASIGSEDVEMSLLICFIFKN